ncbi:COP9 signalosome complex subunit 7a-like isoform X2 [Pomacea canaliculata]|nr:COP9 signalosome complex subunit 7a-like isoform X2 [Pomacea canaliculata]XP_025083432.1 COP9 signalosome complex subunit 7a-like isoform X2 [Pomacea canaliculata]XP_025083433.1 COP9 signalosome complex subunit 7a-like isoform X2 [Pomacea canaliculata]
MSGDKPAASNPLEQFLLLMKNARGAAAVSVLTQALEAPNVYVFGELLDMPNVQELANGQHSPYFNLLNLFSYGTVKDYREEKANLPELTPGQLKKLRHLTVVSLATKSKCIPYSILLEELDIQNVRNLEDLIIEVIYADIIHGKLDQKNQQLEVDYAIGRDIRPTAITQMISVLQEWCSGCEAVLKGIEDQILKANCSRESQNRLITQMESEVAAIKKTMKATHQQDDEHMVTDSRTDLPSTDKPKKSAKNKALRGSSTKLWK